jgi:hypothetical protein
MPMIREPSRPTDPLDRLIFGALTSSRPTVFMRGILPIQSIREYWSPASNPEDYGDDDVSNSKRCAGDGLLIEANRVIGLRCSPIRHSMRALEPETRLGQPPH